MSEPVIPFGCKRIFGQAQRSDRIWDNALQKFVRVKKEYPWGQFPPPNLIIRRCDETQTECITGDPLNFDV